MSKKEKAIKGGLFGLVGYMVGTEIIHGNWLRLGSSVVCGVICYLLAKKKNRRAWLWLSLGLSAGIFALIVLPFMKTIHRYDTYEANKKKKPLLKDGVCHPFLIQNLVKMVFVKKGALRYDGFVHGFKNPTPKK